MRELMPLVIALAALFGAFLAYRASTRATAVNQEANQIKWLEQAKNEAAAAKREADSARQEATETKRELAQTKYKAVEFGDLLEEYTRWILRVIGWARDEALPEQELRRLINGGPPSLRTGTRNEGNQT